MKKNYYPQTRLHMGKAEKQESIELEGCLAEDELIDDFWEEESVDECLYSEDGFDAIEDGDECYDEYNDAYEYEYEGGYGDSSYEDTWWALTDGMYGDCPSNPIAFDAALEALGF